MTFMEHHPTETNIYVLSDPRTGEVRYVGKANDPRGRLRSHISSASRGSRTHRSCWISSLLHDGVRPALTVIENVPEAEWGDAERYWIDHFLALGARLVNTDEGGRGGTHPPDVVARIAEKNRGRPLSEEHRAKLSASLIGNTHRRGKPHDAASRAKMSAAQKGKPKSEAAIAAQRGPHPWSRKQYAALAPDGREVHIRHLRGFCEEHGLDYVRFHRATNGTHAHHRGWRVVKLGDGVTVENFRDHLPPEVPHGSWQAQRWVVRSPDGVEREVVNLHEFCKAHGLDSSALSKVARGVYNHYKGWTCRKAGGPL